MLCEVRRVLVEDYNAAAKSYSHWRSELLRQIGVCSKLEYERLQRTVENARTEVNRAFDALERHAAEHGCSEEPASDAP